MPKPTGGLEFCEAVFNRIYDETFDDIKVFVASKCADPAYISDIIQETYLAFFGVLKKNGADYARDNRAVLFKIAKRRVFRYYSLKQKLSCLVPLFAANGDGEEYCTADRDDGNDMTDEVLNDMESERIWAIIGTFPADVRKIMYLYFNCELSHSEIAQTLGCNISTVKNKLYRTLSEIREREDGYERK